MLSPSPYLPNLRRVHSHVSFFRRKVWASKVVYRDSAVQVRSPFTVLLQQAVGTAAGSPLLSLTSPPRPRFCAEDLVKPCWSTLRKGQPSTRHLAGESCLNMCSHLLWRLWWDSRASVHDLRSPKLSSEQRYITMHSSNVRKMWQWGQQ